MIRAATTADREYLENALPAMSAHAKAGPSRSPFLADLPDEPREQERELVERHLNDPAFFALICERDGERAGCLMAGIEAASVGWTDRPIGHISICWVEPSARRRGVAAELTAAAEKELRHRGADLAELSYIVGNPEAEAAWERLGYEPHQVRAVKRLR